MALPAEIVDFIFDIAVCTNARDGTSMLASLALVNKQMYRKVTPHLYRSPRLTRLNMDAFLDTLEEDLFINSDRKCFAHMVEDVAFMSAATTRRQEQKEERETNEYEHEHASFPSVLRCLTLINENVQTISLDMSCSQAACGCEVISSGKNISFGDLSLPKLRELSCRCPKGYMPPCTRKLLEQHIVGQAASLVDLKLFWTAPGPFGSASNVESSLNQTLRACPNVNTLTIIDSQSSTRTRSAALHSTVVSGEEETALSDDDEDDEGEEWDGEEIIEGDGESVYEDCVDKMPIDCQVLASHAQADSEAPPIAVSASVTRVVSRLGREQGLESRLACVHIPEEEEALVEARMGKATMGSSEERRRLVVKNRLHFERDRGWEALVWLLRQKRATAAPLVA